TGRARAVERERDTGATTFAHELVAPIKVRLHLGDAFLARIVLGRSNRFELRQPRLHFTGIRAELTGELVVLHRNFVDLAAGLLDEPDELFDFELAIAIELSKLLDLALSGVGLTLGSAARELLARLVDLQTHLADFADELVAHALHVFDAFSIVIET